jgi:hypothetical protein
MAFNSFPQPIVSFKEKYSGRTRNRECVSKLVGGISLITENAESSGFFYSKDLGQENDLKLNKYKQSRYFKIFRLNRCTVENRNRCCCDHEVRILADLAQPTVTVFKAVVNL